MWIKYNKMNKQHFGDNDVKKYCDAEYDGKTLEDVIRKAIREERDYWMIPYRDVEAEEYPWDYPEEKKKYVREYFEPDDCCTIREALSEDDSKYRSTWMARRYQRIRVPSMKRTNKEWENFYRTFPRVAAEVATGKERFLDGAKLKYIPLFKRILDEEWPEDLKMWTEEQYDRMTNKTNGYKSYKSL